MTTVMKKFSIVLFGTLALVLTGCYTQLATEEMTDRESYDNSDSSYEQENGTIADQYYLDDDYRQSRLRISFHYYYPSYRTSWIAGYYNSFYDDYYWGWHRPLYWNYYPGYTVIYPSPWWPPIYDPWYPYPYYYPSMAYYPYYYPYGSGGYKTAAAGRIRDTGPTRDTRDPSERIRPIQSPTTGTEVVSGGSTVRERPSVEAVTPPEGNRTRNEVPWWEREKQERRAVESSDRPAERSAVRPSEKRRIENGQGQNTTGRKPAQTRPAERRKVAPAESTTPSGNANGSKRNGQSTPPREERRSYSPPQRQSSPPASAPRSNGGSTSSGNNGGSRKRGE